MNPTGSDTTTNGSENTCRLKKNPCKTIQHAINVAPSAGTIKVAAGTYPEQLTVTSDLSIVGAGAGKTIIQPTTLTNDDNDPNSQGPDYSEAVIVTFTGTTTAGLSDLTVDGSKATLSNDSCYLDYVGVEYVNAGGTLSSDTITGIQQPSADFGCQPGADGGVYVANNDGGTHGVTMSKLTVNSYDKDGITCANTGTTCTITGSTVTGIGPTASTGQNGIEVDEASASISGTTVSQNTYESPLYTGVGTTYYSAAGILAFEANNLTLSKDIVKDNDDNIYAVTNYNEFGAPAQGTWSITGNTVEDATNATGNEANSGSVPVPLDSGVGDGIDLDGPNDVTVQGNTVTGNADWGIALFGTTDSTIGGTTKGLPNTVDKNAADGIYVGLDSYNSSTNTGIAYATSPSTGNTITGNTVNANGQDGIFADGADSSGDQQDAGNTFSSNTLQANINYDAEDKSSGSGTSHTGNDWMSNKCKPANDSSPLGLCS